MKFYTIEFNDKQYVAVEKDDKKLVTLESISDIFIVSGFLFRNFFLFQKV